MADALSNTMSDLLDRKPTAAVGKLVFKSTGESPFTFTLDFDAQQTSEDYQTKVTLHLEGSDPEGINVDMTVGSEAIFISEKNEGYVKLDELEEAVNDAVAADPQYQATADAVMPFIKKIDGQWIKLDTKSLAETGLTESEHQLNACSDAFKELRVKPEDKGAIKDIFKRNQFAIATEKLPKQDIDGEDSFHYKLDLNEVASVKFAKELIELESFKMFKSACEIKTEDFDDELERLEENAADHESGQHTEDETKESIIELWVGAETRLPTKLRITWEDEELTVEFDTKVKINAGGISIKAPEDFITMEEFMAELQAIGEASNPSNLLFGL